MNYGQMPLKLEFLMRNISSYQYLTMEWEREVVGPGGIWGRVQGVGCDHWGTGSQP